MKRLEKLQRIQLCHGCLPVRDAGAGTEERRCEESKKRNLFHSGPARRPLQLGRNEMYTRGGDVAEQLFTECLHDGEPPVMSGFRQAAILGEAVPHMFLHDAPRPHV